MPNKKMTTNKKMVNKKMAATQAPPSFYFFLRGLMVQDQNSTSLSISVCV